MAGDSSGARRASNTSGLGLSLTRSKSRTSSRRDGYVGTATITSGVINLVNTIVGAGVLAMPLAFSHMGILLGTILVIWSACTAALGLYLQTICARYVDRGASSFFALSQMTYPRAAIVFDAAIAVKCFGVGVSYLIIIGDLMPGVVQGFSRDIDMDSFLMDRRFWVTAFMLVVIPFSFLRRLDSLKYTSSIAVVSIGYLVILVIAHCFVGDTSDLKGEVRVFTWQSPIATLATLPVMVFAYTCHQNMFSIVNEMEDPSPRNTSRVVIASTGIAATTYILVAITGYVSFGDNVTGNIISMYPPSVASTIGKAAIVVLVMFSYALQAHPCRASIDAVLNWRTRNYKVKSADDTAPNRVPLIHSSKAPASSKPKPMGETRFAIITTCILVVSYLVAITVTSLSKVLAYVGATGSTSISFILPGLFYYKISDPDSPHQQRLLKVDDDDEEGQDPSNENEEDALLGSSSALNWRKLLLRRLSLGLALYGIVLMVVCLATNTVFIVAH